MTPGDSSRPPSWPRAELWLASLLGIYFLVRLLYFAVFIAPGVPPDEPTHVGIASLYAESALGVEDTPASYRYGLVTHVPFLYHLVLGKLSLLNVFGVNELLFLRLLNVTLSVLTLGLAWRLAHRLTDRASVRLLFLVLVSNTLMYTFLGAAVSYDNLVNLLAVAALLSLVAFLHQGGPAALLSFVACNALGALTKLSFLPLTLLLGGVLVLERRRQLAGDLRVLLAWLHRRRPGRLALAGLTLVAAVSSAWLYGGNLLRYGRLVPTCEQVLSLEACRENRIFARGWILRQYRTGNLTYGAAVAATGSISHPGDREHTLRLLRNERSWQLSRPRPLPPWDYMGRVWDLAMKPTLFGIQAHVSMLKGPWSLLPYNVVLVAAFLLWIRQTRWHGEERLWCLLALVVFLYFVVLVGVHNYSDYLTTHAPFLGVQGRYLFPVLVPAYLVAARALLGSWGRKTQIAVAALVAVVFVLGDFPYFQWHATPEWFTPQPPVAPTP